MSVAIKAVQKKSLCGRHGVLPGHTLISINGNKIEDVLDYQFYLCEEKLRLELRDEKGKSYTVKLRKHDEYADIGLEFGTYLMDKKHSCKNKCIFCFVDQLPKGLRESLYFKDDDERLSFLFGNYVTLTNMSEHDVERIIKMHISPINISVHTMNPELRVRMMKNKDAGSSLKIMNQLASAGIELNAQLVLCPGINDDDELKHSLTELAKLYPSLKSIAVVPLGITKHRKGLEKLEAYDEQTASDTLCIVEEFSNSFYKEHGTRLAFAADEFYIIAGREMPPYDFYEDFEQFENGVGMWALSKKEFYDSIKECKIREVQNTVKITMATGAAAYPLICEFADSLQNKIKNLAVQVKRINNDFFGHSVTVAGLLTGTDLTNQLNGVDLGDALFIPRSMLKETYPQDDGEDEVFLDNLTLLQAQEKLGVKIVPVSGSGSGIINAVLEVAGCQSQ